MKDIFKFIFSHFKDNDKKYVIKSILSITAKFKKDWRLQGYSNNFISFNSNCY